MAATLSQIEEHLNCSVCLGIPTNPHELKCRHTFCLTCIQLIRKENTILCPECREKCRYDEIKHDFKTQRLVDSFNNTEQPINLVKIKEEKIKCELCKNGKVPVKFKCVQCAKFMCQTCKGIHEAIVMCDNHTVKPIEEIINSMGASISKCIAYLQREERLILMQSSKLGISKKNIQQEQITNFATVDTYIDAVIQKATEHRQKLKQDIAKANSKILYKLSADIQTFNDSREQLQMKRSFLIEKSKGKDLVNLMDVSSTIEDDVKKGIAACRARYPIVNAEIKSLVAVDSNVSTWTPDQLIWTKPTRSVVVGSPSKISAHCRVRNSSNVYVCGNCGHLNKLEDAFCKMCQHQMSNSSKAKATSDLTSKTAGTIDEVNRFRGNISEKRVDPRSGVIIKKDMYGQLKTKILQMNGASRLKRKIAGLLAESKSKRKKITTLNYDL